MPTRNAGGGKMLRAGSARTALRTQSDPSVADAVARAAAQQPGALALTAPDRSMTYAELDAAAADLAEQLGPLGAQGTPVGLCLDRSAALVVAALAIVRAGAGYVALDPSDPTQRLQDILRDCGAPLLVSTPDLAERLEITPIESGPAGVAIARLASVSLSYDDVAYVTYTSGSTGTPKGVLVGHDGLLNLVDWHRRTFEVTARDRCTQIASPGFDAFAWEVWSCLATGASLHVVPEDLKTDPIRLRDWLVAEHITVSFLPTPLAEAVLKLNWPDATALRYLLTGGDRLQRAPRPGLPFTLVNNYGVTEGTVVSTSGIVAPDDDNAPSIGRPIDGVRVRIVGPDLEPVPDGVAGELLIGGVSVARGYLGAPDLTATRFIMVAGDEDRWYRTGDVVRRRPDGAIDFLDRIDDQVQIRGRRVEPGEIVAALDSHPAVE